MTRWIQQQLGATGPLVVVAPEGTPARFVRRMLEPYDDDLALRVRARRRRTDRGRPPTFARRPRADGRLDQRRRHRPRARRGRAPRAGPRRRRLPGRDARRGRRHLGRHPGVRRGGGPRGRRRRARPRGLPHLGDGAADRRHRFETIFSYHADTVALGAMAEHANVSHLLLTHLIPAPTTDEEEAAFEADVRQGGYSGPRDGSAADLRDDRDPAARRVSVRRRPDAMSESRRSDPAWSARPSDTVAGDATTGQGGPDRRRSSTTCIPDPPIPLDHGDPYTLLVAVALSAQTTDKKVNQVTPALFAVAPTRRSRWRRSTRSRSST